MITDDEVMQLFERADPARVSEVESTVDAAGYLDALKTRSIDMALVENPARRSDPKAHRWLLMSAAAAVVVVVLGALVVANREDSTGVVTDQTPVATSAPPAPAPATAPTAAESVAANFLAAYAAYDADAVTALLADPADPFLNSSDWRLVLRFMEATGMRFIIVTGCEERETSSAGVSVRCPFDFHALRSNEIGLGPYSDNYMYLTVRDGAIVDVATQIASVQNGFSPELREPFAAWVSSAHPEDALVMYLDSRHMRERITEQSIPLWEQRTKEYVRVVQAQAASNTQGAGVD